MRAVSSESQKRSSARDGPHGNLHFLAAVYLEPKPLSTSNPLRAQGIELRVDVFKKFHLLNAHPWRLLQEAVIENLEPCLQLFRMVAGCVLRRQQLYTL